jgi:hypothetical protein
VERAPTAGEVLGVPAVPPGAATEAVTRARDAIDRMSRALAPPALRVVEGMLGGLEPAVLRALCALDVPDRLDRPATVASLAAAVDADPEALERMLRYAASCGWVRVDRRARVRPTRALRFLRRDHPGGWRAWVDFAGGTDVGAALARLDVAARRGGDAPFVAANGAPFFGWTAEHPDRQAAFDGAMAAGGRMHGLVLAHALDFDDDRVVCDVGGGTGALLSVLVAHHEHLEGVVFDLPHVVARAERRERIRPVGGDAFVEVPAGATTYLLVNVLHDWGDADAGRILDRVASAAGPGARVVVVEGERRARPRGDVATASDLLMLALAPGGRERTTAEFTALGRAAGLDPQRTIRLASGDRAHVFRTGSAT